MDWLDARPSENVDHGLLATFAYQGTHIPLMDRQRGIRKPRGFNAALSIRTVYTPPGQEPPYADAAGPDGLIRYKYRGQNPDHPENQALRRAYQDGLPLMWFVGVATASYQPIYPVWIVKDEVESLQFALALDEAQRVIASQPDETDEQRRYVERLNRQRLHQPMFRARVLAAYESRCAICALRHPELLDAAHIIADGQPHGDPIVPNGLAMCKIHHAAFDRDIIGLRPDLHVEVQPAVLEEIDGPMLRHGLQELHGRQVMVVPRAHAARPDRERLEERYEQFRAIG